MIGLYLSGRCTAADVLSAEISLRGAAAHPYKLCLAKAKELSGIIQKQWSLVLRVVPKFIIITASLDSNHGLELNLLELEN